MRRGPWLPGIEVVDIAVRDEADVDVRHHDREQAHPRELHVAAVEPARLLPRPERDARLAAVRHAVLAAADEVAERVAAERVAGDEDHVEREDQRADADAGPAVLEE